MEGVSYQYQEKCFTNGDYPCLVRKELPDDALSAIAECLSLDFLPRENSEKELLPEVPVLVNLDAGLINLSTDEDPLPDGSPFSEMEEL